MKIILELKEVQKSCGGRRILMSATCPEYDQGTNLEKWHATAIRRELTKMLPRIAAELGGVNAIPGQPGGRN